MKEVNFEVILEIINRNIEVEEIIPENVNDNLSERGMDSIRFIQIVVELEEIFECEIPDSKLIINEMNTVRKIYDVLSGLYESQSSE